MALPGSFVQFLLFSSFVIYNPSEGFNPSICAGEKSCNSCIGAFGCTWCKELRDPFQRCNTVEGHRHNKCPAGDIVKAERSPPRITQDEPISKSMRIQPQKVNAKLAVGQDISIDLRYNDNTDKALDLYYIMDLSATMEDDKDTVSKQAEILVEELKKITGDVRLGFGAFIDKPVLPFVASSQLRADNKFDIPYGFKNWLSLTNDIGRFRKVVKAAKISRNLDEPEGTLDALMQAITCKDEIKWRDTNTTRKLIVVATDGPFHIAGDGKLGGIVRPNDLKCHMKDHTYTHSTLLDYPSIGEINAVILEHKVYVIFAVSKPPEDEVYQVYDELQNYITQSTTEQLKSDSSNVVEKIRTKYLELSQTVTLTVEEAPSFVEVTILVNCSSKRGYVKQNTCNNVRVGQIIDFKINLKLKECPDPAKHRNLRGENKVVISFFELTAREKLIIDMDYACTCDCNQDANRNQDPNTLRKYCSGADAAKFLSCGLCKCEDDRYGESCQCSVTNDQGNITNCVNPGTQYECSTRGQCRCGQCECPRDFNGKHCEHSTTECQNKNSQFPNRICSDKGDCVERKCVCSEGYEGSYCECESTKKVSCVEPGQSIKTTCNGHGTCMCSGSQAQCKCNSDYSGLYCGVCKINCPASPLKSRCKDKIMQDCVRCKILQYHSKKTRQPCVEECDWKRMLEKEGMNSGRRSDVGVYDFKELTGRDSLSDEVGTECQVTINSTCSSTFKYSYQRASQHDILQVFYSPHKLNCAEEPPVLWYIIGVIVSVLLAGIIGLLIWKLATHLHDKREYQKFEQERSNAKWHGIENPLYDKPTSDFENPAYARHSTVPSMK